MSKKTKKAPTRKKKTHPHTSEHPVVAATEPIVENLDPNRLLRELREFVREHDAALQRVKRITARIYRVTYLWVRHHVETGVVRNGGMGVRMLAKHLGKLPTTVDNWYRAGECMAEHGIPDDVPASNAISRLAKVRKSLPRADVLRVVDAIKSKKDGRTAARLIEQAKRKIEPTKRADVLARQNLLTLQRLRMETLALVTMANKITGHECSVMVYDMEADKIIASIPEQP